MSVTTLLMPVLQYCNCDAILIATNCAVGATNRHNPDGRPVWHLPWIHQGSAGLPDCLWAHLPSGLYKVKFKFKASNVLLSKCLFMQDCRQVQEILPKLQTCTQPKGGWYLLIFIILLWCLLNHYLQYYTIHPQFSEYDGSDTEWGGWYVWPYLWGEFCVTSNWD